MRTPSAILTTTLLAIAGVLGLAAPANAADYSDVIEPTIADTQLDQFQDVRIDFTFVLPDAAVAGDTATLQLPAIFDPETVPTLTITDPVTGETVATSTVDRATGLVTLTFTDYVDSRTGVSGSGFFTARFEQDRLTFEGGSTVEEAFGETITITQPRTVPGVVDPAEKTGYFLGSETQATALNPDGTLVDRDGPHIRWSIVLPAGEQGTAEGDWTSLTVSDEPDDALVMCAADGSRPAQLEQFLIVRDVATGSAYAGIAPGTATVSVDCSTPGVPVFTVTKLDPEAFVGRQLQLVMDSAFRTDADGRPTALQEAYPNAATIAYGGEQAVVVEGEVRSTDASGSATGVTVPAIDIEKYSGDWEGVRFDGAAADVTPAPDLEPTNQPAGDVDTGYQELVASEATQVRFTFTNIGTEPLRQLVVTDTTIEGGATLTSISCTVGDLVVAAVDGVVTFPADVELARQAAVTCTATLPALGAGVQHRDSVRVTGVSTITETTVTDADVWGGRTPEAEVPTESTPPVATPPVATPPVATPPTAAPPTVQRLPETGSQAPLGVAGLAALLVAAGGMVLARARRSRSASAA